MVRQTPPVSVRITLMMVIECLSIASFVAGCSLAKTENGINSLLHLNKIINSADGTSIIGVGGLMNLSGNPIARITKTDMNGNLDNTFLLNNVDIPQLSAYPYSQFIGVVEQPDGKILTVGDGYSPTPGNVAILMRFNSDGTADSTFGDNGLVETSFFNLRANAIDSSAEVFDFALYSDGRILVMANNQWDASVAPLNGTDMILTRYLVDGSVDTTFGQNGFVTFNIDRQPCGRALAILPDNRILVTGSSFKSGDPHQTDVGNHIAVLKFNTDGSLDSSFGTGGVVKLDHMWTDANSSEATEIIAKADGKILVAGRMQRFYEPIPQNQYWVYSTVLVQFNSDGTLDNTYGDNGIVAMPALGAEFFFDLQPAFGNKIMALMYVVDGDGNYHSQLARFNDDGSFDPSFAVNGVLNLTELPGARKGYVDTMAIGDLNKMWFSGSVFSSMDNTFFNLAQ